NFIAFGFNDYNFHIDSGKFFQQFCFGQFGLKQGKLTAPRTYFYTIFLHENGYSLMLKSSFTSFRVSVFLPLAVISFRFLMNSRVYFWARCFENSLMAI